MTLRDFLHIAGRRWYVVAAVFMVGIGLYFFFLSQGGVYSTRTTVSLMMNHESSFTPDNSTSSETVIAFAGTIASTLSRAYPAVRYSNADAPYYGAGIREGVLVGLRDEGSQWAPSYGSAVIEIQIVGRTQEWVEEKQEEVLTQVQLLSQAQQLTAGARPEDEIVARVQPLSLGIEYIKPSIMALAAGAASTLAGSGIVAIWAAVEADRILHKRARNSVGGMARGTN